MNYVWQPEANGRERWAMPADEVRKPLHILTAGRHVVWGGHGND